MSFSLKKRTKRRRGVAIPPDDPHKRFLIGFIYARFAREVLSKQHRDHNYAAKCSGEQGFAGREAMRSEKCVAFFGDLFTTMVARVFFELSTIAFWSEFWSDCGEWCRGERSPRRLV